MNQFNTEDFSDIKTQPMEKLIKLRDRRKQNWQEMQKAAKLNISYTMKQRKRLSGGLDCN